MKCAPHTSTYDTYGNLSTSTGTAPNPFGFAGQFTDAETGLIYLRARFYDTISSEFVTRDPVLGISREAYAYAKDGPTNLVDPSGLWGSWWDVVQGVGGAASWLLDRAVHNAVTTLTKDVSVIADVSSNSITAHDRYQNAPTTPDNRISGMAFQTAADSYIDYQLPVPGAYVGGSIGFAFGEEGGALVGAAAGAFCGAAIAPEIDNVVNDRIYNYLVNNQ